MSDLTLTPTAKQAAILRFILDYSFAHGFSPPIRAICQEFGISSPNGVVCHLRALIKKGHIRRVQTTHFGETKTVYIAARPAVRVDRNGRGGVLLGTVGGPVAFTRSQWITWLRQQLAEAQS